LTSFLCFQDEGALVRAAQNLGFVFSGRTPDSVIVELVSQDETTLMKADQAIVLMDGWIHLIWPHDGLV